MCFAILLSVIMFISSVNGQLIISEVMFDPATSEYHDEFVEIFNLSFSDSADVTGLLFSDSSGLDEIIPHTKRGKIAPRAYAIILDGSYFENSSVYDDIIPDSVMILKTKDSSLGSAGLSNSIPEKLMLLDSMANIISAYRYSIDNPPGHSDEMIVLDADYSTENWGNSNIAGGTPGFRNSISPHERDAGFRSSYIDLPGLAFYGTDIPVMITVANMGTESIKDSITLDVFIDVDEDSLAGNDDRLLHSQRILLPAGGEDYEIVIMLNDIMPGNFLITARISYPEDNNLINNIATGRLQILQRRAEIRINEIKFLTEEDEPEWVELINSGPDQVFLNGWGICDAVDTVLIDSPVFIQPGEMKVLCRAKINQLYNLADSMQIVMPGFPTLNNSGDELRLIRPDGSWQEFVRYQLDWLEGETFNNPSLERINPGLYAAHSANWGPCVDGLSATPGKVNSIFTEMKERNFALTIEPSPFSPDLDGLDDVVIISGEIPGSTGRLRILVFDIRGRIVRRLTEYYFTGNRFSFVWDGRDDSGRVARIGIYIVFLQFINDREGVLREAKATVVLAGKL